jgi:hypothetical protein
MRFPKWLEPLALGLWVHLQALLTALLMIVMWVAFDHDLKRVLRIYSIIFGATMLWGVVFCYHTRQRGDV